MSRKWLVVVFPVVFLISILVVLILFRPKSSIQVLGTSDQQLDSKSDPVVASASPLPLPANISLPLLACDRIHLLAGECRVENGALVIQASASVQIANSFATSPSPTLSPSPTPSPTPTPLPQLAIPSSTLSLATNANSSYLPIREFIVNGGFAQGLTNWQTSGEVTLNNDATVRIGHNNSSPNFIGNQLNENSLSQTININQPISALGFWYRVQTYENLKGFDEPAFQVVVNNQTVFHVSAAQAQDRSDWQMAVINLSHFTNPTLQITFLAGNTGDNYLQSLVELKQISTLHATINQRNDFQLHALSAANTVHLRYHFHGLLIEKQALNLLYFTLTDQPDNGLIEYWATNETNNEAPQFTQVWLDQTAPPAVGNLQVFPDQTNQITTTWTTPNDNFPFALNITSYDLRYSLKPISPNISNADWQVLPQLIPIQTTTLDQTAIQQVSLPISQQNMWLAVRSLDQAENLSPISNIVNFTAP